MSEIKSVYICSEQWVAAICSVLVLVWISGHTDPSPLKLVSLGVAGRPLQSDWRWKECNSFSTTLHVCAENSHLLLPIVQSCKCSMPLEPRVLVVPVTTQHPCFLLEVSTMVSMSKAGFPDHILNRKKYLQEWLAFLNSSLKVASPGCHRANELLVTKIECHVSSWRRWLHNRTHW